MSGATVSNVRATFNRGGGGSTHSSRGRARDCRPRRSSRRTPAIPSFACREPPFRAPRSRFPAGCSSWGCRCCCSCAGWWPERCVTRSSSSSWRCSSPCSSTRSSARSGRFWIPRGLAVAIVYLTFAAAVALAILALATVVVQQTRHASNRIDNYFTVESGRPPRDRGDARPRPLPGLARHAPSEAHPREKQGQKFLDVDRDEGRREVHDEGAELGGGRRARRRRAAVQRRARRRRVDLHAARHAATCGWRRPALPAAAGHDAAIERMEQALASYVKGQLALSVIIGASCGLRRLDARRCSG